MAAPEQLPYLGKAVTREEFSKLFSWLDDHVYAAEFDKVRSATVKFLKATRNAPWPAEGNLTVGPPGSGALVPISGWKENTFPKSVSNVNRSLQVACKECFRYRLAAQLRHDEAGRFKLEWVEPRKQPPRRPRKPTTVEPLDCSPSEIAIKKLLTGGMPDYFARLCEVILSDRLDFRSTPGDVLFLIRRTPVSAEEFQAFEKNQEPALSASDHWKVNIDWDRAHAYCAWLTEWAQAQGWQGEVRLPLPEDCRRAEAARILGPAEEKDRIWEWLGKEKTTEQQYGKRRVIFIGSDKDDIRGFSNLHHHDNLGFRYVVVPIQP